MPFRYINNETHLCLCSLTHSKDLKLLTTFIFTVELLRAALRHVKHWLESVVKLNALTAALLKGN